MECDARFQELDTVWVPSQYINWVLVTTVGMYTVYTLGATRLSDGILRHAAPRFWFVLLCRRIRIVKPTDRDVSTRKRAHFRELVKSLD